MDKYEGLPTLFVITDMNSEKRRYEMLRRYLGAIVPPTRMENSVCIRYSDIMRRYIYASTRPNEHAILTFAEFLQRIRGSAPIQSGCASCITINEANCISKQYQSQYKREYLEHIKYKWKRWARIKASAAMIIR